MTRERLRDRRLSETFMLELHRLRYVASFSRFDDGRIAEVFLQNHKNASQSDSNARDSAIAASLALQYGCPLETLRRALLRGPEGQPQTPFAAALDRIVELEDGR
jgi:ribonucleoside-diphosphate reductase alpha chain